MLVVAELLGCPLARVQMHLDDDTAPILPTVLADLAKIMKGLRSLSVIGLPADLLVEMLQLVSTAVFAPKLRYLGVLPLPSSEVSWGSLRFPVIQMATGASSRAIPSSLLSRG